MRKNFFSVILYEYCVLVMYKNSLFTRSIILWNQYVPMRVCEQERGIHGRPSGGDAQHRNTLLAFAFALDAATGFAIRTLIKRRNAYRGNVLELTIRRALRTYYTIALSQPRFRSRPLNWVSPNHQI